MQTRQEMSAVRRGQSVSQGGSHRRTLCHNLL
jgi:hypothetical protein